MATVDQLVTRLEDLSAEVCSEKVTARNKAIDQVKQIFDSSVSVDSYVYWHLTTIESPDLHFWVLRIVRSSVLQSDHPKYIAVLFINCENCEIRVSRSSITTSSLYSSLLRFRPF